MKVANQATPDAPAASTLNRFRFDSAGVDWKPFVTEGCFYRLLQVDLPSRTAEMLVKFTKGGMCLYHRHVAWVSTMVLEGELRVYEQTPQGEVLKIKPAGSYSAGGKGEIHIEGGGEEGAIVYYNMRTDEDVIYEILGEDLKLRRAVTVADFHQNWRECWQDE